MQQNAKTHTHTHSSGHPSDLGSDLGMNYDQGVGFGWHVNFHEHPLMKAMGLCHRNLSMRQLRILLGFATTRRSIISKPKSLNREPSSKRVYLRRAVRPWDAHTSCWGLCGLMEELGSGA